MLLSTTIQFREHVPISGLTQIATLTPYIREAEERHIRPILGDTLYDELEALSGDVEGVTSRLLMMVRGALANLAMYSGFDMINVQFDETGFTRSSAEKTLYRYQEENLKNSFRNKGFDYIDNLLELLQFNISTFDKFKQSTWYKATHGAFFTATSQFNAICNINGSRLVFIKIAAYFDRVIDFEIIPALGQPLYDKLKAEMVKDGGKDADLMALVPIIQKALAHLSIYAGVRDLNYNITDKGLVVEKQTAIGNSHIEVSPIDAQMCELVRGSAKIAGDSYLNMLITHLVKNRDKYPDYTQDITHSNPLRRDNTGKKTCWL